MIHNKDGREGSADVSSNHRRFLLIMRDLVDTLQGVAVHLDLPGAAKECDDILGEIEAALEATGASSSASVSGRRGR